MSIKISSIQFYDYRAFYDGKEDKYFINTENKNLLIYGENGSGKTSFFKGVKDFFYSTNDVDFIKHNRSTELNAGFIKIKFSDGTEETFSEDGQEIPTQDYIKSVVNLNSFLTYKELLKTYLIEEDDDELNLFDLLVEGLLKEHELSSLGKLDEAWYRLNNYFPDKEKMLAHDLLLSGELTKEQLNDEIERIVEKDEAQLNSFGDELQILLDEINEKFKKLLLYFDSNLSAELKCNKDQITGREKLSNYRIDCRVNHYSKEITEHLSILNEARLSALAITIYLSAILKNPSATDYKILFLDDIFIGLDMSNRLPLLDIIKKEFRDWQVFITTFDRHFYEIGKRQLELEMPNGWKSFELYAGIEKIDDQLFEIPIIKVGETNFEKGMYYLHNPTKPEYPAAANFFRKALEEIILNVLPVYERVDLENKIQILDYKLGPLINLTRRFLERTGNNTELVKKIITFLPILLHPLSHYEVTSQVYKVELLNIENLISKLHYELEALNIKNNYKCSSLEGRTLIKIKYIIDATIGHFSFYELRTTEPLLLINNPSGSPTISGVKCNTVKCWGEKNGATVNGSKKQFSKTEISLPEHSHISLLDAYDKIHSKIIQYPFIGNFAKAANYLDAISYLDQNGDFKPITEIIR